MGLVLIALGLATENAGARAGAETEDGARAPSSSQAPDCLDRDNQAVSINNVQVSRWKASTPNGYLARGHISGILTRVYRDARRHHHWQVRLDGVDDSIEVIYSEAFGPIPAPRVGAPIEACGDYITANSRSRRPSPDGALVHWVHISTRPSHPSGFVLLDGVLCGQNPPGFN